MHAGLGTIALVQGLEFAIISESSPVFVLTCITSGGPATSVVWTRNGVPVGSDGDFTMTQIILNTTTSTYQNQLTVSGRHLGTYRVFISNSRQPSPVQSLYTVRGAYFLYLT